MPILVGVIDTECISVPAVMLGIAPEAVIPAIKIAVLLFVLNKLCSIIPAGVVGAARPVNWLPSIAGSLPALSNCTTSPADVPTFLVAAVPRFNEATVAATCCRKLKSKAVSAASRTAVAASKLACAVDATAVSAAVYALVICVTASLNTLVSRIKLPVERLYLNINSSP